MSAAQQTSGASNPALSRRSHTTSSVGSSATQPVVASSAQPVLASSVPPVAVVSPAARTAHVKNINGQAALTARMQGKTGGFSRSGRELVFASSAPSKASSPASATGDLWGGVQAGGRASIATAASSGGQSAGLSTAVVAGLVIFGIGLVGLAGGGAFVVVANRRRAQSGAGDTKRS